MFSYTVKVNKIRNPRSKIVAFASLIIDEVLQIEGFKVIDGSKGLFVSPPQHKGKDKEGNDTWYEDVRFIGEDNMRETVKKEIHTTIINEYQKQQGTTSRATAAQSHATLNQTTNTAASVPSSSGRRPLW